MEGAAAPPGISDGDWLIEAIDAVIESGRQASAAIADFVADIGSRREARLRGRSVAQVVEMMRAADDRAMRIRTMERVHDFEHALHALRASLARGLVDDDGLTISDVAPLLGISRQAAARLYSVRARHGDETVTTSD